MSGSARRAAQWRSWLLLAVGLIVVVLIAAIWYRYQYSMTVAQSFEVPGLPDGPRVLVATQGSDFKDALTAGLIDHLKRRSAFVKVIDVSELESIEEADWNAMVVMHTWEMRKAPIEVKAFVDRMTQRDKLVVLTTSGTGAFKLEGVDAISAASRMDDVAMRVGELAARVDAVLDAPSPIAEAGTPVWSWQMTPAVRAYLQNTRGKIRNVAFFVTSGDTDVERIAPSLEALAGRNAVASAGFKARELADAGTYQRKISALVDAITGAMA